MTDHQSDVVVVEYDLSDPEVEAHTLIEIPVYGLPEHLPETDEVRVMVGGISRGIVANEPASVLTVLFDAGAFKVNGWKLELAFPVEFQPISERSRRVGPQLAMPEPVPEAQTGTADDEPEEQPEPDDPEPETEPDESE